MIGHICYKLTHQNEGKTVIQYHNFFSFNIFKKSDTKNDIPDKQIYQCIHGILGIDYTLAHWNIKIFFMNIVLINFQHNNWRRQSFESESNRPNSYIYLAKKDLKTKMTNLFVCLGFSWQKSLSDQKFAILKCVYF